MAKAGDLIFKPTKESMENNVLFTFSNKVKILPSQLSDNAAIYGAAALVWNELGQ
jgi:glucokinase